MPPTTLQVVINQLSTLVMGEDIDESLWANIHNKRKRGEKMRKPGEKGAPKPGDFERARGEEVEEDRDYKKEYENYHSKPEQIKRRQKRNEARRSLKNFKDIKGKDLSFASDGLLAICIQHEVDHLKGKVFVDYISNLKRSRIRKKLLKQQVA